MVSAYIFDCYITNLFVFLNKDVSIIPEECGVKYEKVGCFNKKTKARTLSVLIFSDRKTGSINWKAWEKHLKRQVSLYNRMHLVMLVNKIDHIREMDIKRKYFNIKIIKDLIT